MAGEWRTLSLCEAGVSLIDCEHRTPPAADTGYPYVAIPQIKQGRLDLADVRRIAHEHFIEWTRKAHPQPYDVILSRRCNPGETAFVPPGLECALGQNLVLLRSDGSMVFPPFLRWLVRGNDWWEQIGKFLNVGAVFDSLKCADIPNFRMPIPPVSEQKVIAHILGTLDDKIELNRRMNETLEAIARVLFKSWFIDFDPVRRNMTRKGRKQPSPAIARRPLSLGEGQGEGVIEGDTFDHLFPDRFQDSELGEIPEGWDVTTIAQLAELNASTLGKHDKLERIEYVEISEVACGDINKVQVFPRGEEPGRARRRLRHGDTVLSTVRPERGAYFLCLNPSLYLIASTGFTVISPKRAPWSLVHAALTQPEVPEYLGQQAHGGAYPAVRPEIIGQWQVAWPDESSIVEAFHRMRYHL